MLGRFKAIDAVLGHFDSCMTAWRWDIGVHHGTNGGAERIIYRSHILPGRFASGIDPYKYKDMPVLHVLKSSSISVRFFPFGFIVGRG